MAVLSELADVSIVRRQNVGSCLQISHLKALPEEGVNLYEYFCRPGPEVIKLFPCSTQLSMKL